MPSHRIEVCLEVTPKQAFAFALEWPGWCRAGRDEGAALEVLARYAGRYAPVAAHAGVSFPATVAFDVAERVPGGPATAFAAPECRRPFPQITAAADRATVTPAAARRLAGLLAAVWATFDGIAAASPAELRKGPRGGGRDRDQIIGHVIGAPRRHRRDRATARGDRRRAERPIGRITRGPRRLGHALRSPPDRLAPPRTCLGDARPGRQLDGPAGADQPGPAGRTRRAGDAIPRHS